MIRAALLVLHLADPMRVDVINRRLFITALFNCRGVTTFYGFPTVAEQDHVRKSWRSRVEHPMLLLSQNVTT